MIEENVYDEFEVRFNYRNVFYICQVKLIGENEDSFFQIEYFSPNEKGNISQLSQIPASDGAGIAQWVETNGRHESAFLQTIGREIEKHEK